jgi:hypothetical protein
MLHPIFVANKYRTAPPAERLAEIDALSPDARAALFDGLASDIFDDARRRSHRADAISAQALTAAFAKHTAEPKPRLVFDSRRSGLNEALAGWPFQYCSIAQILHHARPGWLLGSNDISSAFHLVAEPASQYKYCGWRWPRDPTAHDAFSPGGDFVTGWLRVMFFGLKTAPAHFSALSGEMVRTLQRRSVAYAEVGTVFFFVIMDDIFTLSCDVATRDKAAADVKAYLASINAPTNKKEFLGQTVAPLLGLIFDSTGGRVSVSLPADKRFNCTTLVALALRAAHEAVRLPHFIVEKMVGKLGHAHIVFADGIVWMPPLYDALYDSSDSAEGVDLSKPDCVEALTQWYGLLIAAKPQELVSARALSSAKFVVNARSDASSTTGWSFVLGSALALWGRWDASCLGQHRSIEAKELWPLVHMLDRYGRFLRGLTLSYKTDNAANAYALNAGNIRDAEARPLLLAALRRAARHGVRVVAAWCPREANAVCDRVSKAASAAEADAVLTSSFVRAD